MGHFGTFLGHFWTFFYYFATFLVHYHPCWCISSHFKVFPAVSLVFCPICKLIPAVSLLFCSSFSKSRRIPTKNVENRFFAFLKRFRTTFWVVPGEFSHYITPAGAFSATFKVFPVVFLVFALIVSYFQLFSCR